MNQVVIPQLSFKDILDELVAVGNLWNGAIVKLFKNDITPSPAMVLADLDIADFTGYANSAAIVWHAAGFLPDGTAVVTGDLKVFEVGASPTVLNTIFGYYVTDAGGTNLLLARRFDTPRVLSGAFQLIEVVPSFPAYLSD